MPADPSQFDPYEKWLGIPRHRRPASYYDLLGIDFEETDPKVVQRNAARRRAFLKPKLNGPRADAAREALYLLGEAVVVLTNPPARRKYDRELDVLEDRWAREEARARRLEERRPEAPPAPAKVVGEDAGILRTFLIVLTVLGVGCGAFYLLSGRGDGPINLRAPDQEIADDDPAFGPGGNAGPLEESGPLDVFRGSEEPGIDETGTGDFAGTGEPGGDPFAPGGGGENPFGDDGTGPGSTDPEMASGDPAGPDAAGPDAAEEGERTADGVRLIAAREIGRHAEPFAGHVAVSADGTRIVSGGQDGRVRCWLPATGAEAWNYPFRTGAVAGVHAAPDGGSVWAVGKEARTAVQLAVADGEVLRQFRVESMDGAAVVQNSALSRDGEALTVRGEDGAIEIYETRTGRRIIRELDVFPPAIVAGRTADTLFFGGNEQDPNPDATPPPRFPAPGAGPGDPADTPDSPAVRAVRLRDNWQRRARNISFEGRVDRAALDGLAHRTTALALAPGDVRLAAASGPAPAGVAAENKVVVWSLDAGGGTKEREITLPGGWTWALAFSPDGQTLATGDGGTNDAWFEGTGGHLWDVQTGAEVARLTGADGTLSLAYAPDGRTLYGTTADGRVLAWTLPAVADAASPLNPSPFSPSPFNPSPFNPFE